MDDTDLCICQLLLLNSRMTHQQVADEIGISAQAVHRRITAMMDSGAIRKCTANLSLGYLSGVSAFMTGTSESQPIEASIKELGSTGFVSSIVQIGFDRLGVNILLRNISDLDPAMEAITRIMKVRDARASVESQMFAHGRPMHAAFTGGRELDRQDYRILQALHEDSRRPVADLAVELGISAKTIGKRIDRMVADGSVEFSAWIEPSRENGIPILGNLSLTSGVDMLPFRNEFNARYGANVLMIWNYSTMPRNLTFYAWFPNPAANARMQADLQSDPRLNLTTSGAVTNHWWFETWRGHLLKQRAARGATRP